MVRKMGSLLIFGAILVVKSWTLISAYRIHDQTNGYEQQRQLGFNSRYDTTQGTVYNNGRTAYGHPNSVHHASKTSDLGRYGHKRPGRTGVYREGYPTKYHDNRSQETRQHRRQNLGRHEGRAVYAGSGMYGSSVRNVNTPAYTGRSSTHASHPGRTNADGTYYSGRLNTKAYEDRIDAVQNYANPLNRLNQVRYKPYRTDGYQDKDNTLGYVHKLPLTHAGRAYEARLHQDSVNYGRAHQRNHHGLNERIGYRSIPNEIPRQNAYQQQLGPLPHNRELHPDKRIHGSEAYHPVIQAEGRAPYPPAGAYGGLIHHPPPSPILNNRHNKLHGRIFAKKHQEGFHNKHGKDLYKDNSVYRDNNNNNFYNNNYNTVGKTQTTQKNYFSDFYGKHKNNNYVKGKAWGNTSINFTDERRFGHSYAPVQYFPW